LWGRDEGEGREGDMEEDYGDGLDYEAYYDDRMWKEIKLPADYGMKYFCN
jgi:hypothetical protein